jgi:NAD+ kinase
MQIAVFGRTINDGRTEYIKTLYQSLSVRNANMLIFEPFYKITKELLPVESRVQIFNTHQELIQNASCMLTIGGDGTLLEAITFIRNSNLPVLGINTGRLGFLSGFSKEEIDLAVDMALNLHFTIEKRTLIQIETNQPYFGETPFALNEVTFHKKDNSSMITLQVAINGMSLNTYWADGLIIATPTGSTGYSLSCGGPIIMPESQSIVLTPIAPHNLNVRPLVISDSNQLSISAEIRGRNFLVSLDSRSAALSANEQILIKKAPFSISLGRKPDQTFLQTLREKLNWGLDKRN